MQKHLLFFFGRKEARITECKAPVEPCLPPVVLRAANRNINDCRWQSYNNFVTAATP